MAAFLPTGPSSTSSSANPYAHYDTPSISDVDDLIDPDDDTLQDLEPHPTTTSDRAPLVGNITTPQARSNARAASSSQSYLNSAIPGEDRRAPLDTLDESVWATLRRDLLAVWEKMRQVLWPKYLFGGSMEGKVVPTGLEDIRGIVGRGLDAEGLLQSGGMSEGLRDWDLWGPLLFCLLLSFFLSMSARDDQRSTVFSGVFALVWIAEAVVTLQIKLLGGNIAFFQSVCIIGYTLFPLVIASVLSAVHVPTIARIPVFIVLALWSLAAGVSILGGSGVVKGRLLLAVYPLFVFYVGLACLCFIS